MLQRASVQDVKSGKISRAQAYLAVAMRFYPRFLRKEWVDEYIRALAPPADLFKSFKELDRKLANHNSAFYQVEYEKRFKISQAGREELKLLSQIAEKKDVFLICQCRDFDRCHCDLLLMMAERNFKAPTKKLIFDYPDFKARLDSGEKDLS